MTLGSGLRLAVSTLTVWPAGQSGRVDRSSAAWAMSLAPAVGAALGGIAAAITFGVCRAGAPSLLAAVLAVVGVVLATRALHLDGLADTADALGSYASADRALAIMRSPEVGPFGVAALVLVLGVDVAAIAALGGRGEWWAVLVGVTAGRAGIALACRRGVPAARPDGLGALVAGTVAPAVAAGWVVLLGAAGYAAVDARRWEGPVAVLVGAAVAVLLAAHARRRLGGITGDVLGAVCELSTAATLVVLALT